jgi:hypothetical protein
MAEMMAFPPASHATLKMGHPWELCRGRMDQQVSLQCLREACVQDGACSCSSTSVWCLRAALFYAGPCYAMLCHAMPCHAMPCHAMLCYAMLRYATLRYAMLCYAILCHAPGGVMPCTAMLFLVTTKCIQPYWHNDCPDIWYKLNQQMNE